MFGLHSYRCLRGQRWLKVKAFNLIRERCESSGNFLKQSCVAAIRQGTPAQALFFSTSASDPHNTKSSSQPSSSESDGKGVEAGVAQSGKQLDNSFDDILVPPVGVDSPGKAILKRYIWQLDDCFYNVQQSKSSNNPANLLNLLPRTFPKIVALSMNPDSSDILLRGKCLRLLLTDAVDHKYTKTLLKQTQEDSNSLPLDILFEIVQRLATSSPTEFRKQVRRDLVATIVNKRWHEIEPKLIVSFMYQLDELYDMKAIIYGLRSVSKPNKIPEEGDNVNVALGVTDKKNAPDMPVQSVNLERCILDVVDDLKPKDLARVITLMAKWRSRNRTVLDAVIHRLSVAELTDFNFVQLLNLLSACSTLTIHNETLLDSISVQLTSQLAPLSPSLTASLLAYFTRLKWCHPELISKCLVYAGDCVSEMTGKEASSVLTSIANLYPLEVIEQHKHVISALGVQAFSGNPTSIDIVNTAWCLAILRQLDSDRVVSVLEPSFAQQFQDTEKFVNRLCLQKLQQINTCAKLEFTSYNGPYLASDSLPKSGQVQEGSKEEQELRSSLHTALSKFVSPSTYVEEGKKLDGGYTADALMCADLGGTLKPLSELENVEDNDRKFHRLALKVLPFKGVISPQQNPSGTYQMEARHLKAMGYTPVAIFYSDLLKSKSALDHVNAIQERIRESVKSMPLA